jgi:hypothetical protein
VEVAERDYRDLVAYAEYPNYMWKVPASQDLARGEKHKIIEQDWQQYKNWLQTAHGPGT